MTLGEHLRSKRIESGKSLEQVAASTKIHIKILNAIEENLYSELPARTFTRGFIVNYAKALRLDPDQLLKEHQDYLELKFAERANRDEGHQGYAFEGKELEQNKRWMVIGASIALLFAVAVLLVFKPQNHKRKEKHKDFEEETSLNGSPLEDSEVRPSPSVGLSPTVALDLVGASSSMKPGLNIETKVMPTVNPAPSPGSNPFPNPTSSPAASPTASPQATPATKRDLLNKGDDLSQSEAKRKISFQAKEDLWVRYKSDDRPAHTLILRKGRYLVIKAKSRILVELQHPEAAQFKQAGKNMDITLPKLEVSANGDVVPYLGGALGSTPVPEEVPSPKKE